MKITRKTKLLGSALAVILLSSLAMASDFHSLAELQKARLTNQHNVVLLAKEMRGKCVTIGNSTTDTKKAEGFCLGAKLNIPIAKLRNNSALKKSSAQLLTQGSALKGDSSKLLDVGLAGTSKGANCVSVGGSKAGAAGNTGAFCLAADIKASNTPSANFSVANGLPVEGLQLLQVSFRDGSKLVGSRPFTAAGAATGAKCVSVGGSNAGATGAIGDFCVASDLVAAATSPAKFSLANSLPVASLQLLQITFKDGKLDGSNLPIAGAKCASVGGSSAVNGGLGGFCLVSDLSTSATNLANFAVANKLPAAGLQFLQVTFRDGFSIDKSGNLLTTPLGAKCVSANGGSATTGATGEFCLVSKLSTLASGFAGFSIANDLPVKGLQFLQVMFGDSSPLGGSADTPICKSAGGSTSAVGANSGFCLTSDRRMSNTSYANFSVANNLPVTALQFVQAPFRDSSQQRDPRSPADAGAVTGVTLSYVASSHLPLPNLARFAGHKQRYFGITEQASGIVMRSNPHKLPDVQPVFWLGR
jgi:hypothetical protein